MKKHNGSCLCGAVTLETIGEPDRVGICHCKDCKKHHGALFYAAAIFKDSQVQISGTTRGYKGRNFCPVCGSSVFSRTGDEIEVHLGILEESTDFMPGYELWTDRRVAWLAPLEDADQFGGNRDGSKEG